MKCAECGKELVKKTQKKFCSCSCSTKYNNRLRKTTTKNKHKNIKCRKCGKEIEISIHTARKYWFCDECSPAQRHNRPHYKELTENASILDISKRTAASILKRMNAKCSLCGWNESSCDIHHIIPKKHGGTDSMDNLICICPNCHRVCHTTNKYDVDLLKKHSLDKEYKNWKEFYHPSN